MSDQPQQPKWEKKCLTPNPDDDPDRYEIRLFDGILEVYRTKSDITGEAFVGIEHHPKRGGERTIYAAYFLSSHELGNFDPLILQYEEVILNREGLPIKLKHECIALFGAIHNEV